MPLRPFDRMNFLGGMPPAAMSESNAVEREDQSAGQVPAARAEPPSSMNGEGSEPAGNGASSPPPDSSKSELEAARRELKEAESKVAAAEDRSLRIQAEFENARKRLRKEKEEALRYAAFDTIRALLDVLDDLERAIESPQVDAEAKEDLGLEKIRQKMLSVFNRFGLSPVDQHETFDPRLHEALASAPAEDGQSDQQILEVWKKGYLFKDRLMRASWVKVAVKE